MSKNKIIKITLALVAIIILVVVSKYAWSQYQYRYISALKDNTTLFIPSGATLQTVLDSLDNQLKRPERFKDYAVKNDLENRIKPGKYIFKSEASYAQIIRYIQLGLQSPINLTFNNLRSVDKLAGAVSRSLNIDSTELVNYLLADSTALLYGFDKQTFISMFIPNTYQLYWNETKEGFTKRMHTEYERFWTKSRQSKAKKKGLTPIEVSTLASIVYEETKMSDEMPRVAGVYLNRIKKNMPLQADPTVKFAMGDFSIRRILYKHIKYDSPYNTYKYKGLPPGAICMPSITSIDAVLNAEKHDYIFFCASPDFSGYHAFARTLKEHNNNAKAYSTALNKRKIYK